MWIVRLALRRPYTFAGYGHSDFSDGSTFAILRTPTDIFPNIDIPRRQRHLDLQRSGSKRDERTALLALPSEASLRLVDNIEHIESQSLYGIAVVKVFLQPNASHRPCDWADYRKLADSGFEQLPHWNYTTAGHQAYSASSVPVSATRPLRTRPCPNNNSTTTALNFIRTQLITIQFPGAAVPYPYGGKQRQVQWLISIPRHCSRKASLRWTS